MINLKMKKIILRRRGRMNALVPHSLTGNVCEAGQKIDIVLDNEVDYLAYKIDVEAVQGRGQGQNSYVVLRDIQMFGPLIGKQCLKDLKMIPLGADKMGHCKSEVPFIQM